MTRAVIVNKRYYFSYRKMLLSKSHHLVRTLKTESQDELITEGRLNTTDVQAEPNKPGMKSFAAPVLSSTEQT